MNGCPLLLICGSQGMQGRHIKFTFPLFQRASQYIHSGTAPVRYSCQLNRPSPSVSTDASALVGFEPAYTSQPSGSISTSVTSEFGSNVPFSAVSAKPSQSVSWGCGSFGAGAMMTPGSVGQCLFGQVAA